MTRLHNPQSRSKEESGGERLGGPQSPPLTTTNPFDGTVRERHDPLYHIRMELQAVCESKGCAYAHDSPRQWRTEI